jgi:serine/threonine protein phosphatase 1
MTDPIYAIPDIHGQDALLDDALARIERDGGPDARIIFLGDLVDRGPDSRAVIERILQARANDRRWTVLRGNHDQMFLDFLDNGSLRFKQIKSGLSWLDRRLGGAATLASYGITATDDNAAWQAAQRVVPQTHRDFMAALPLWHEAGDLLFVHAGIRPGVPLDSQTAEDLMWIRDGFLEYRKAHPWLVVHGHTALDWPQYFGNRVDLDAGAGYGRPLWPAVFEGAHGWLLTETGRIALCP